MAFPTNANQVQAFAGAMYGIQIGSVTLAQVNNDILAAGSLTSALNSYYTASFGSVATATVAATVAANLGLTGDALNEGTAYITAQLNAAAPGARGAVIANTLNLFAGLASDATFGAAATAWNTKVAAAAAYTAATDVAIGTVVSASRAFTLTTSADSGSAFTGTSSDDSFTGVITSDRSASSTTFGPGDVLAGAAGNDTFRVSISGTHTADQTHASTTTSGIESLMIDNFETSTFGDTIDASLMTGLSTVALTSSSATGDLVVSNLRNIVNAEMSLGAGDLTVSYQSTVIAGAADTQNLAVNGLTAGTFTAASVETINITSSGTASTLTAVSASSATTLNIAAAAALTVTNAIDASVKTVNASASTLGVSLVLPDSVNHTVTGGAGNDTIRMAGGQVDANDSINAGDGNDTIILSSAVGSATVGAKLVGFETMRSYQDVGATDTLTLNASFITGLTTASVSKMTYTDDNDGTADAATVTAAFTGIEGQAIAVSGITSAGDANDTGAMTAVVSVALKTDTTTDAGTVTLGTATASAFTAGANNAITFNLTADDYETLTIANQGAAATASTALTIGTLSATDATKLVINATKALTVTTLTATAVRNVDASGSTAAVDLDNTALSGASTVLGGSGNDAFQGSSSADNISGNVGDDLLTGAGGNDIISGGNGNDTIIGNSGADVITGGDGNDSITAGGGNDNIDAGAGNDTFNEVGGVAAGAYTLTNLTTNDTIVGGEGTDKIQLTGTLGAAANFDISSTALTTLSGVSGVETLEANVDDAGGAFTITLGDIALSAFGGSINVTAGAELDTNALVVNAGSVVGSSNVIKVTAPTTGLTYTVSNGVDSITGGTGVETVVVATNFFLGTNDVFAGGANSDILRFTSTAGGTISAAQLNGVTGFEVFDIETGGAGAYVLTITDSIASKFVNTSTNVATFERDANAGGDTGTQKFDGSAVTTYKLAIDSGSTGADTLAGGALADTISGGDGSDSITGNAGADVLAGEAGNDIIIGGDGNDTITGGAGTDSIDIGAGTDTVIFNSLTGYDTVAGFAATGSSSAPGDSLVFDISDFGLATDGTEFVGAVGSVATGAGEEIVVLTGTGYASDTAVITALEARVTTTGLDAIVVYFNTTSGKTTILHTTDSGAAGTVTLVGTVDITSLAAHDLIGTGNIASQA
jgi:Ca2+-binding RTX toxin-like protein